ncbi:hypothetical protein AD006_29575 (plasmid) [Pseudonocardia sp. EC080610-09]|nr:hypothetical protein AD006_29575 [Pseudonocardia sp. EC080610-09]
MGQVAQQRLGGPGQVALLQGDGECGHPRAAEMRAQVLPPHAASGGTHSSDWARQQLIDRSPTAVNALPGHPDVLPVSRSPIRPNSAT